MTQIEVCDCLISEIFTYFFIFDTIKEQSTAMIYSSLPNNRAGWNKRAGWQNSKN